MPTEEAPRERGGGRLMRSWEKGPLCWGREGDVNGARWFQGEEKSKLGEDIWR